MPDWVERLKQRRSVAHLLRAAERFDQRLGMQFAAAITYFSVLSIVPVLMFAFALLGMTLTVFRPELLDYVRELVNAQFRDDPMRDQIIGVMEHALRSWPTLIGVSMLVFAWGGATWVHNLKDAIRAQMRPDLGVALKKPNPVLEVLINLGILIAVLTAIGVMFALSAVATALSDQVLTWLQVPPSLGPTLLVSLAPIPVALGVGFCLFAFLYRVCAVELVPPWVWATGASVGSIGLSLMQLTATKIWGLLSSNPAASVFGPVIIMMLFLNLFAALVLFVAAWMSTWEAPVENPELAEAEAAEAAEAVEAKVAAAVAAELADESMVRQEVALKAIHVGVGTGWVLGAATGVGVGAAVARVVAWIARPSRG